MAAIAMINLGLRFLLELCLLAALGYWGFRVGQGPAARLILGLGAPLLAVVVWGLFMAPKATVPLPGPLHLAGEVALFGLAAAALFAAGQPRLAVLFAVAALVNRLLIAVLPG